MDKLGKEALFWNIGHPKRSILGLLLERVLSASTRYEPAFKRADPLTTIADHQEIGTGLSEVAVPVHPEIADALNLEWYDPSATYQQYGGHRYTYTQYFDAVIRYSIGNKLKLRRGEATALQSSWQLPMNGPAFSDYVAGYFPDGFIGPSLQFQMIAEAPLTGLTIRGLCPAHHPGTLCLTWSINDVEQGSIETPPGTMFTIECAAALEAGQSARVELISSGVMNLLARGESEDARDLSVLILGIDVRPMVR